MNHIRCGDTVLYEGQRAKVVMIGFEEGGDVIGVSPESESGFERAMVVVSPDKIKVLDEGASTIIEQRETANNDDCSFRK